MVLVLWQWRAHADAELAHAGMEFLELLAVASCRHRVVVKHARHVGTHVVEVVHERIADSLEFLGCERRKALSKLVIDEFWSQDP